MSDRSKRKNSKDEKLFHLNFKWIMLLSAAAVALILLILAIIFLPRVMYTRNPRLVFKNLEIDSTGYWQKQPKLLLERIGLEYGTNMFAINPADIREKLESEIPSIESAEVRFVLPDTLKIKINERIPRASLYSANSPLVVDRNGKVMKRAESSAIIQKLPVIKHFRSENQVQLQAALKLIMSALSNYPEIAIQEISLSVKNELRVSLYYRERKRCVVLLPSSTDEDYDFLLSKLQTVILTYGSNWQIFDLRFRGVVTGR